MNSTLCDDDDFRVLARDIGKPLIIKSIQYMYTTYIHIIFYAHEYLNDHVLNHCVASHQAGLEVNNR